MDDSKPADNRGTVNEPSVTYGAMSGKKVRIFNSFQEQEDEMINYWASITPKQRLAHLYEMVKVSFGISEEAARKRQHYKKATIIKYEP